MHTTDRIQSCLTALAFILLLSVSTPAALQAQSTPDGPAASEAATVKDLPVTAEERQRFTGLYSVTTPDPEKPSMSLRIFEEEGALMGAINSNDPTRILYQGNDVFRPEAAAVFVVTFTVEGDHATRLSIMSPDGPMDGVRVEQESNEWDAGAPASPTSGALYDQLARLDSLLFDAAFVSCDTESRNFLFTDDVEFYHDRVGFRSGQAVKAPIESCPRDEGLTRHLVEGSLEVYPIKDYGAVQMGVHRFVENGAQTSITAKFVHLWQEKDGAWRISRVLSFDHR